MSNDFYHTHARDYFNQPIEVDPTSFLSPISDVRPLTSDLRYLVKDVRLLPLGPRLEPFSA